MKFLLDSIYPRLCHFCKTPWDGYLCDTCSKSIPRVECPRCERCGEPFEGNISTTFLCPNCHGIQLDFDFAIANMKNHPKSRQLVQDFKYGKQHHLATTLAKRCLETIQTDTRFADCREHPNEWLLCPVPLHWRRKMKRTFNQSELIAIELSKLSHIPWKNLLCRTKYTGTQTRLSRDKRLQNIQSSITLNKRLSMTYTPSVILIDDVFTTGSTAQACAQILKKHGKV